MDNEQEPGSELGGGLPDEPQADGNDQQTHADTQPAVALGAEPADGELPASSAGTPEPETGDAARASWSAADSVPTDQAVTDQAATGETVDQGDDSDAPIHLDDDGSALKGVMPQNVKADTVHINQGGAQTIKASTVTVSQGGAGRISADSVTIEQGGLGVARAKTLTLGPGASAFAVVADEAKIEHGSNAVILIARSFEGDVQPTIDWRTALAFGAGLGLVLAIIRRLR